MEFLLVYQVDLMSQSPKNKNASPKEIFLKNKSPKGFHTRFSFPHPMNCYPRRPGS